MTEKVRIAWNNFGGEMDSVIVENYEGDGRVLTKALIALVKDNLVHPGDSFTVRVVDADE